MDELDVALAGASGLVGLLLGSFGNVLIYRIPRGESIVSPPSRCPNCGRAIRPSENVPVISWLWLRGRCAGCGTAISGRYPLVELATGAAFFLVTLVGGLTFETLALLLLTYFGVVLSAIDLEHHRLPNALTGAFAVLVAATLVASGLATGDWGASLRGFGGAAGLALLYGGAFVVYPKGMGFGDVKLAPTLGAAMGFLGWPVLAVGAFAAFLWGAVAGVVSMIRSRRGKGVGIPFGPWMFVGALTGVLFGEPLASWYLDLVGL